LRDRGRLQARISGGRSSRGVVIELMKAFHDVVPAIGTFLGQALHRNGRLALNLRGTGA
jgi:hypothetical protein